MHHQAALQQSQALRHAITSHWGNNTRGGNQQQTGGKSGGKVFPIRGNDQLADCLGQAPDNYASALSGNANQFLTCGIRGDDFTTVARKCERAPIPTRGNRLRVVRCFRCVTHHLAADRDCAPQNGGFRVGLAVKHRLPGLAQLHRLNRALHESEQPVSQLQGVSSIMER